MGNNPSTNAKSPTSLSSSSQNHDSSRTSTTRRDPKNLIQAQRAPAEPSLAQARGTTTASRRTRSSSHAAASNLNQSSASPTPSQNLNSNAQMGVHQLKQESAPVPEDIPSKPVDVPTSAINVEDIVSRSCSRSIEPSGPPTIQDMSYHLTRPPRLPLPIEEEVHTPGSPMLVPTDVDVPVLDMESLDSGSLARGASALSNNTIDEEDEEELRVDTTKATVPTIFEWRHGGEKVYITGTIFQWNKKYRVPQVEGQPGIFRTVIQVLPGTHHIRFIVDAVMQCSPDLPTTVDFGNNLVNYIEVSADDIPEDVPPSATASYTQVYNLETQAHNPSENSELKNVEEETAITAGPPAPRTRPAPQMDKYTSKIPQYLDDLEKAEDSNEYRTAAAAIEKLPTPPSLPGFLEKPILNAATPMKDDNSVLLMPNHTVLNHLVTTSIKNKVLAVSATSRYKRKYFTTIMYKPSGEE